MKQNERILVYAVTGFLAIILVVAVLFGRETPANKPTLGGAAGSGAVGSGGGGSGAPALSELFPQKSGDAAGKAAGTAPGSTDNPGLGQSGLPSPGQVAPESPLTAPGKPLIAADLVAQALGANRRDRTVRFVRAREGDSLESLVRRWCGAREPYLEEAKCLNEELSVLHVGQEVAVPWVDDEAVLAAYEARQPKKLVADASVGSGSGAAVPAIGDPVVTNSSLGDATPPPVRNPSFAVPGSNAGAATPNAGATTAGALAAGRTKTYVVKSGDSLWKIAERLYGKKNVERMVTEIKKLNPGKTDRLLPDQKLTVPEPAPAAAPGGTPTGPGGTPTGA